MTKSELSGIRLMADAVTSAGHFELRDRNGRLVAFDLTRERAEEWARFYQGATIIETFPVRRSDGRTVRVTVPPSDNF